MFDTVLLNAIEVVPPEQKDCEGGVAVITGEGLTVTVAVTGLPEHPFNNGVTVYTAVPATLPVVVSIWKIPASLLANAPVTPV